MSKVENILERMITESSFAESVFADAGTALAEYDLSSDEIAKFKDLSRADFEAFSSTSPEERKSFGNGFYQIRDEGG